MSAASKQPAAGRRRERGQRLGVRAGAGRDRVDDDVGALRGGDRLRRAMLCEPRSWPSVSRTRIRVPLDICFRRATDRTTAS